MHAAEQQVREIAPAVTSVIQDLDGKMRSGLDKLSWLRVPSMFVQPLVDQYNGAVRDVNTKMQEVDDGAEQVVLMCRRLMTLREAGERWQGPIADERAFPLAENLDRSELQGNYEYSWKSGSVDSFWNYIEGNKDTAGTVASLCQSIGDELIELADAQDKQAGCGFGPCPCSVG